MSANKEGLSDLNFWDKSRASGCMGIISAQSVASFYAALGERDLADALLQNFRQKICFRTEDRATLNLFTHLSGKVNRIHRGQSLDPLRMLIKGQSETEGLEETLNPQLIRSLGRVKYSLF